MNYRYIQTRGFQIDGGGKPWKDIVDLPKIKGLPCLPETKLPDNRRVIPSSERSLGPGGKSVAKKITGRSGEVLNIIFLAKHRGHAIDHGLLASKMKIAVENLEDSPPHDKSFLTPKMERVEGERTQPNGIRQTRIAF